MAKDVELHFKETGATKTAKGAGTVDKSLTGVSKASKSAAGGFKSMWGQMALGTAAFSIVQKGFSSLIRYMGDSMALADEQAKVEAQLNAVLESTGHAAGLSAEELKKMATEFQNTTTWGDEAVLSAENLLLTFTNIGKDVFPQATATVLDMSTALGQDLKSSSVQLGKALNDPIKGITALSRVGVTFTEKQKEVIKKLAETGDVAGAQKLILAELNKEFGGSAQKAAETMGGKWEQLTNKMGDFKEVVGTALYDVLLPALESFVKWVEENQETIIDTFKTITSTISGIAGVVVDLISALAPLGPAIAGAFVVSKIQTWAKGFSLLTASVNAGTIATLKNASATKLAAGAQKLLGKALPLIAAAAAFKVFSEINSKLKELSKVTDQVTASHIMQGNQVGKVAGRFREMAKQMGLTTGQIKAMRAPHRDITDLTVQLNKTMRDIRDGKHGEKLAADFEKWRKGQISLAKQTRENLNPQLKEVKKNIDAVKASFKNYSDIIPPAINATRDYGIDLLPKVNEQLDRQLELIPDINLNLGKQATAAELLAAEMRELDEALNMVYGGLNEIDKILGTLDMKALGDAMSSFFKGGADIAAGIAMFKMDPLGGLANIISGIGELAKVLGGTNWEARGRIFNSAIGGLIPPELMGDFIALAEEMGDFNMAYREMLDTIIEASDITSGGDMWTWIQELARQIKSIAGGGGDIDQIGDAFEALAAKGAENIGFLGRDFQILITAIQNTGQEMEALTTFLDDQATAGLEGYIAAMEAGFTSVVIPTYQEAQRFKEQLAEHDTLVKGVEGWEQAMISFGNTAKVIYQDDLAKWMQGTVDAYDELIAQDFSKAESLDMLLPQLRTLNQMASDYNLELDAGTQALIDQAREAGFTIEAQQSGSAIMKEGFEDLTLAINNLTKAMTGDMTDAIVNVGKVGISAADMMGARWTAAGSQMVNAIDDVGEAYEDVLDFVNSNNINIPTGGGGNIGAGFQHGTPPGGFRVPPGFPNDSFPIGGTSGEVFHVEPSGETQQAQPGNITFNIYPTIYGAPGGDTEESLMRKFWHGVKYDKIGIQKKLKKELGVSNA
jgi:Prophage tail length tape measure protein.